MNFSFKEIWPDKVHTCPRCGGNVYESWSWVINGAFYCGDCAEKLIEEKKVAV